MSSFFRICTRKATGEKTTVHCIDNHYGHRQYGYKVDDRMRTLEEFERDYEFEQVEAVD